VPPHTANVLITLRVMYVLTRSVRSTVGPFCRKGPMCLHDTKGPRFSSGMARNCSSRQEGPTGEAIADGTSLTVGDSSLVASPVPGTVYAGDDCGRSDCRRRHLAEEGTESLELRAMSVEPRAWSGDHAPTWTNQPAGDINRLLGRW
jgi:hypothetical protein